MRYFQVVTGHTTDTRKDGQLFFFSIAIDCGGAVKIKTWPRRKKWGWFYLSISIDKNKKKKS